MKTLLLPGLDGTGALFAPFLNELDPALGPTVIAYPADSIDANVDIPRGERFAIVAESFSGAIALRIAATRPAELVAVVLVASFIRSPLRFLPRALVRPWLLARVSRSRRLIRHQLLDSNASDELVDLVARTIAQVPPAVLAGRVRRVLDLDVTQELRKSRVPLLYLRATRDRLVSERALGLIRTQRREVQVAAIVGPHFILQCNPAPAARAIELFLKQVIDLHANVDQLGR